MKERRKPGRRKLRFFLDALLTLALLLAVFAALSSRVRGEEARFRRAERADLAGPSEIIARLDVPEDWPVRYDRLLLGDDGEEIFFYLLREGGSEMLYRREKTGGMLLTPVPCWNPLEPAPWRGEEPCLPLLLFTEVPAARAEVRLRLSETCELELASEAGETGAEDGPERARFFLFRIPVPKNARLRKTELLRELLETNAVSSPGQGEFPATIRLYDEMNDLLETREFIVRSRSAG